MEKTFMRGFGHIAWLIVLGMSLLLLDFISKSYVYHVLTFFDLCPSGDCINIPVFFDVAGIDFMITPTVNSGAAWGILSDFQVPLLIVRIIVIFGILVFLTCLNENKLIECPLVLITAGALGNVLDFFLYGFVVDFFHFNLWGYHFPVFNVADICITIGVSWLLLISLFTSSKQTAM